jgi:cold shock CspA family protein
MATRHKGIIAEWHTARGFGLIEPDTGHVDGEERIFCPIDAFLTRMPLPKAGLEVSFEVERGERDRLRAVRVIQAGATIPRTAKAPPAQARKPIRPIVIRALSLLAVIVLAALAWMAIMKIRR